MTFISPLFPGIQTKATSSWAESWFTPRLFKKLPDLFQKMDTRVSGLIQKTVPQKTADWMTSWVHYFSGMPGDFDYKKFSSIFGAEISQAPMGSFLWQLYPFLIGPRLYYAWKRAPLDETTGKKDRGEVLDVLRRDITAVTVFLFAYEPIRMAGLWCIENLMGIRLLSGNKSLGERHEISLGAFSDNYFVDSAKRLLALASDEKNRKGLLRAVEEIHVEHDPELLQSRADFKKGLEELLQNIQTVEKAHGAVSPEVLASKNKIPEAVIQQLETKAESVFQVLEHIATKNKDIAAPIKQWWHALPNFMKKSFQRTNDPKAFLANYARHMSLPVHAAALVMIVLLLGYAPAKINSLMSDKHYKKKAEEKARRAAMQGSGQPPTQRPAHVTKPVPTAINPLPNPSAMALWVPSTTPHLTFQQQNSLFMNNPASNPWVLPTTSLWNQPTMMLPTQPR